MSLEHHLIRYIRSLRKAAKDNMRMSVAPKFQVCGEKHKVILRNLSIQQRDIADDFEGLVAKGGVRT